MIKIAVHLHIHYVGMWAEMAKYLRNLGNHPYDLFVTLTSENKNLIAKIKKFKPDAAIWSVENRGYDVGPFVDFLCHINLDDYDYILKIHTKRNFGADGGVFINGLHVNRYWWHKLLLDGVLGSPTKVNDILWQFSQDKTLGMVGSEYLLTSEKEASAKVEDAVFRKLSLIGFPRPQAIKFIAGTMFWCRAFLLKPIKENFALTDFSITNGKENDGTLAHILERMFGVLVEAQKYQIKSFDKFKRLMQIRISFKHFLFQQKITTHGYKLIKICKIPIYHKKVK